MSSLYLEGRSCSYSQGKFIGGRTEKSLDACVPCILRDGGSGAVERCFQVGGGPFFRILNLMEVIVGQGLRCWVTVQKLKGSSPSASTLLLLPF